MPTGCRHTIFPPFPPFFSQTEPVEKEMGTPRQYLISNAFLKADVFIDSCEAINCCETYDRMHHETYDRSI